MALVVKQNEYLSISTVRGEVLRINCRRTVCDKCLHKFSTTMAHDYKAVNSLSAAFPFRACIKNLYIIPDTPARTNILSLVLY